MNLGMGESTAYGELAEGMGGVFMPANPPQRIVHCYRPDLG